MGGTHDDFTLSGRVCILYCIWPQRSYEWDLPFITLNGRWNALLANLVEKFVSLQILSRTSLSEQFSELKLIHSRLHVPNSFLTWIDLLFLEDLLNWKEDISCFGRVTRTHAI